MTEYIGGILKELNFEISFDQGIEEELNFSNSSDTIYHTINNELEKFACMPEPFQSVSPSGFGW